MKITDGDWTLFDYDFQSGRSIWSMEDGPKTHFRITYPVDATLARNEAIRREAAKNWAGDYHLIASVPLNTLYDENLGLNKAWIEGDDQYVKRWLNDGTNAKFRVKEGRV